MPNYLLPFKQEAKVLEIGGGPNPIFRPNLDIRAGPAVDIVHDANEPLPIESESYEGCFSQFLMEHLHLSKVRGFLSEIHRILKPGGIACIITANLLEQAKLLIEKENEWTDDLIIMVFGGNPDYPENYHKSSMSPAYAIKRTGSKAVSAITTCTIVNSPIYTFGEIIFITTHFFAIII